MKAAEVLVPHEVTTPEEEGPAARGSAHEFVDPMKEFSKRLEDIIRNHGPAAALPDRQVGGRGLFSR